MSLASRARFRAIGWIGAVLCLGFVGIQFIRPTLTNPPVTAELQAPPEVKQILRTSCYSCHSNETRLPWFDRIVAAFWIVTSDVREARRHLNFSEIGKLPAAQQKGFLFEAVNMIQMGAMPLPSYLRVHPGAAVTPEQLAYCGLGLGTMAWDRSEALWERFGVHK
jgi:Haem-binding domain